MYPLINIFPQPPPPLVAILYSVGSWSICFSLFLELVIFIIFTRWTFFIENCSFLFKKNFFLISKSCRERGRVRRREGQKEREIFHLLITQMVPRAPGARPFRSQEPGATLGLPCGIRRPSTRTIFCCFPGTLSESWIGHGAIGHELVPIWHAIGRGLAWYAMVLAPNSLPFPNSLVF